MNINNDPFIRSKSEAGFRSTPQSMRSSAVFAKTQPETVKNQPETPDTDRILKSAKESTRRPKSAYTFRPRECFFNGTFSNFGKDAPKIAIGCSRPEPPVPPATPGPGAYEIPPLRDTPQQVTIPRCVKFREPPSPTANVELVNTRSFPQMRACSIAPKTGKSFYDYIDSPGPSYVPPSSLSPKTHKIASRYETRTTFDSTPGPGSYNPQRADLERSPVFSMHGISNRDDWLKELQARPGPGHYTPKQVSKSQPRWTFGSKSRKRSASAPPIPLGPFLFKVDSSLNREECYNYIEKKPQLRALIEDIFEYVILYKPEDPVACIRERFASLKEDRVEEKTDDLSMDIIDFTELLK
ncbi:hypothetical protein TVAG_155700 [Trichomonas vaginalis G3]|uniref:Uncharacterized protein n=1 Tax=Trichomonas vaginalis (strain ATCC PRA-98 / G3) TaxID=412133 RepID=A2FZC3_TRIV3|nr:sperm-tail PG-rich repeat-containing protein [Trichomonas vaginalis G3]EAX89749.1 hypothetical protein TVAG_155700 [Trichomonas vaginalis G3]KAI5551035.1 sperm-tail PG-rich repeat-containing protein [Trichomonas vaginalis G3]|eukprot:XP_001302679.1 hypothetical protein [Trichomonas vaginalis G3]